jgi:hypothetical protein
MIKCSFEGCTNAIKDHLWGHIKAEGWFFKRNGDAWCPDHIPAWVAKWRKNK